MDPASVETQLSAASSREGAADRRTWLPWVLAALIAGLALRALGWLLLRRVYFCGIPGFEDAVHHVRCLELLTGGFPERTLPWGSPLYPYLAACLSTLVGTEPSRILLAQVIFGVLTIPLVAWGLAPLLARRGRWIAALLYGLHPMGLFFEMRFQPTAFAVLLFILVLRVIFLRPAEGLSRQLLGGLLLGVGFLLKPLLFFALAVAAAVTRLRGQALARSRTRAGAPWIATVALALGFLILPVLTSFYHASLEGGGPTWNWSDAHGFHRTLSPQTWGCARSVSPPAWEGPGSARAVASEAIGRRVSEWGAASFYRERAVQRLVENPLQFIGSVILRALLSVSRPEIPDPVSADQVLTRHARVLRWGLHLFPLYLALAAIGLWRSRFRGDARRLWPLLLAVLAVNILGTHSSASRWFLVVALLPAAAVGCETLPGLVKGFRRRAEARLLLGTALLLLVFSAADLPSILRFPASRARYENASEDLRQMAALARQRRDARTATSLLRDALRVDPQNPYVHADLGAQLMAEDLREAARQEYAAALAIDPDHEQALYGMTEVLRSAEGYAEAESLAAHLVQLHPRHPLYLNQYGVLNMLQGKFARARFLFEQALAAAPDYSVAQMNLRTLEEAEREAPGLAFPEEMIPSPGSDLLVWGQAALQAMGGGNWAGADSLTALGLASEPDHPMAWYLRGAFLMNIGRYEESARLLERVVRTVPGRALTTEMAARALLSAGRPAEALDLARWSLERAPDERNRSSIERVIERTQDPTEG